MRMARKKQAENFTEVLKQAHDEIKQAVEKKDISAAMILLEDCQNGAIALGNLIENEEGEGFRTVSFLEDYCELVYQIHESFAQGQEASGNQVYKKLRKVFTQIENSVRNDIRIRYEIAFLPYKASMWDSLESIWQAAKEDPDCDVYVVPIPYYDKNPDGSLGMYHYEGNDLPSDVPVIHYDEYRIEERKPDAVYIHNPYDNYNFVTTVDPRFYSSELKKFTECLVYVPYYSTTGGMSEGQASCPAYYYADYIIIQAEKYRQFFDPALPAEKLVPLGSPKFDRVLRMCANPPEIPAEWKKRMEGRKVYFYNTSINGMLGNTDAFLKKMRYVFNLFKGRTNVCLLWRPHPLLESTFDSMRKEYRSQYDALKEEFIAEHIGIYDDTPDMTKTIACSDIYIGDGATSVTSLFGMAGKPLFIFNNRIHTLPEKDDWRGEKINPVFDIWGDDRYQVSKNNQLWFSENNDYHYRFYMDLGTGYMGGGYYLRAVEIKGKIYVFPRNAQHLLIIKNKKIRKLVFKERIAQAGAFCGGWYNEKYIFLFPDKYPLLVRFTIDTEEIHYVEGIKDFYVRNIAGEWRRGGICLYGNELVFASPEEDGFVFMDIDTLKARGLYSHSQCNLGTQGFIIDGNDLWLMPLNGMTITCWNPETGAVREYDDLPPDFKSVKWPDETECEERPFGNMVFYRENGKETIIISPQWGNMYLTLDRENGRMEEWKPPVKTEMKTRGRNGYFTVSGMGGFRVTAFQRERAGEDCQIWYAPEKRLYDVNLKTGEYQEVEIDFDYDELKEHEPGFMEESEWMQYCLVEGAFNSLKNLLDDNITGRPFDWERQIRAYAKINANVDGTCGEEIHRFVRGKL